MNSWIAISTLGLISILSWFSAIREYKLANKRNKKYTLISGLAVAGILTFLTILSIVL